MATTSPPVSSSPAPSPAPAPAPTPIKPGVFTSEFWVKVLCSLASLLLASGVIPTTGQWAQLGSILGLLAGSAMYTHSRTKMKIAALRGAPVNGSRPSVGGVASAVGVFALIMMCTFGHAGCAATKTAVASGGSAFLSCEKTDITQISSGNSSIIATVAIDLASANYVAAIADAIAKFGSDAVGCAVVAIEQVFGAKTSLNGSATPAPAPAPAMAAFAGTPADALLARAKEMKAKYGWQSKVAK